MKRRRRVLLLVLLLCIIVSIYFFPKSVKDTLNLEGHSEEFPIYCTVVDFTDGSTGGISAADMDILLSLFDVVKISGPVFYKNAAFNGDIIYLYLAIPNGESYKHTTIELIVEDGYKAFLNIDQNGYFILDGGSMIIEVLNTVRRLKQ